MPIMLGMDTDIPIPSWVDGPEEHAPCWSCAGVIPEDHRVAVVCDHCADLDPDALLAEVTCNLTPAPAHHWVEGWGLEPLVLDIIEAEDELYELDGPPW